MSRFSFFDDGFCTALEFSCHAFSRTEPEKYAFISSQISILDIDHIPLRTVYIFCPIVESNDALWA
jgi:hypothetical protein